MVLRKAHSDLTQRAGGLTEDEVERVTAMMQNAQQDKMPDWSLNREKDVKDGNYSQVLANGLDNKLHEDLEQLKKSQGHRGLCHFWGLRVFEASTPRPQAAGAGLWLWPRRSKSLAPVC